MKKDVKVAAIQTFVPKNKDEGEKQILRLVKTAVSEPVDLVGLPEDCLASREDIENGYDPFSFLSRVAKENSIYLFGATESLENGQHFNTGFLFNRNGELIAKHNKVVLTPPEEQGGITPGKTLEVFDTEFGKMALLVCKDSFHRYAAWFFDKLRRAEAEIILIPTVSLNVTPTTLEMWISCLKALVKWFHVYAVVPDAIGLAFGNFESKGNSLILCPKRLVLAQGSVNKEEILRATLDGKSLEEIRNTYGSKWQPPEVPQTEIIVPQ